MIRFSMIMTILSCGFCLITPSTNAQENSLVKAGAGKASPIYVKILWPIDPSGTVHQKDHPAIESWIVKSMEKRPSTNFRAVTGWVPLVEDPLEATDLWDGKLDGKYPACGVYADITERKEGFIKITFRGWGPGGQEARLTINDEPGSRDVVPVNEAAAKHGKPHIAIFVGPQLSENDSTKCNSSRG